MYFQNRPTFDNFIRNIPLMISGATIIAFYLLSFPSIWIAMILMLALVAISFFTKGVFCYWRKNLHWGIVALSCCILARAASQFYSKIIYSGSLQAIAAKIGVELKLILIPASLLGAVVGMYIVILGIELLRSNIDFGRSQPLEAAEPTISRKQLFFILAVAVVTITICSKSSPIYPFNDWVDPNCFMTVGKSMLHGFVPYRDLFDHKGPLLYMLHALAALISDTTFLGVYFLEIAACTGFLYWGFKLARLYHSSISVLVVPIIASVIYTAACFRNGDSPEELCLPFIAYAVYVALNALKKNTVPSNTQCLWIGVTSACILWIKFSMLGCYLGWILIFIYQQIKQKQVGQLFSMILFIILGILITTVPILVYFGANGALNDLWTVYFYDNLFVYSSSSNHSFIVSSAQSLWAGISNCLLHDLIPFLLIIIGGLALTKEHSKKGFSSFVSMVFFTFLLVYIGGQHYAYYALILSAFAPIGVVAICSILSKHGIHIFESQPGRRKIVPPLICIASLAVTLGTCKNTYMLRYSKSELPQYQFAEIITQFEDPTLLNYGALDAGFYTTTGIVPNCKYFYRSNLLLDEMLIAQDQYIEEGTVDFVVTYDQELESENYEQIATSSSSPDGSGPIYYLYRKK